MRSERKIVSGSGEGNRRAKARNRHYNRCMNYLLFQRRVPGMRPQTIASAGIAMLCVVLSGGGFHAFAQTPPLITSPPAPVSVPAPDQIRDMELGAAFVPPKSPPGWNYTRMAAGSHVLDHSGEKGAFGVMTIEVRKAGTASLSTKEMTPILRTTLNESADFTELKERSGKSFKSASGIEGARIEFDAKLEDNAMRGVIIGFAREGRVVIFTGICPAKSVKTYLSGFDTVARSLTVTAPVSESSTKP